MRALPTIHRNVDKSRIDHVICCSRGAKLLVYFRLSLESLGLGVIRGVHLAIADEALYVTGVSTERGEHPFQKSENDDVMSCFSIKYPTIFARGFNVCTIMHLRA